MSSYNVKTHPAFAGYELGEDSRVSTAARRLINRVVAWSAKRREYLNAIAELESLSDRDLADIGIARCDIPDVVRNGSRSKLTAN
jgi:uncharacterized protein YjiS (DUF1127 family)